MSYTALYRKFRPETFDEVSGQEPIVRTLKNQIKTGKTSHAYLFCGTRGTGKTTIAKIMAKAVNCEAPEDGSPCGKCEMCRAIASGSSMNVIEIDAASNNGVDNIREIVEEVRYSPTKGHYKVYIIDEVHMLSPGAFNALLKTLEEPPSYVMFILATTEVHKLPVTILSRCQRYNFTRIPVADIASRLTELCEKEEVKAEERALQYIARAGDGALRDAISLLDRCIAFYPGELLTYDSVLEILGTVDTEIFTRLLSAVSGGDVADVMRVLDETVMRGRDLTQFVVDFTWFLRNLLIAISVEHPEEFLDLPSERMDAFLAESQKYAPETLVRYITICSDLTNRMRYATAKRVMTEVTFLRLCKPETESDLFSLADRIRHVEELLRDGVVPMQAEANGGGSGPGKTEAAGEVPVMELPKAIGEDLAAVAEEWSGIVGAAKNSLRCVLQSAKASVDQSGNRLLLVFKEEFDKAAMEQESYHNALLELIGKRTGKQVEIVTELAAKGKGSLSQYPDLSSLAKKVLVEFKE